jgi:hypothetical protein
MTLTNNDPSADARAVGAAEPSGRVESAVEPGAAPERDVERPAGGEGPGASTTEAPPARAPFAGALRAAALEAALVVFGVVLAFAANEWREHRAKVARAEHALESILDELRANRDAVETAREYHAGLLSAIREAGRTGVAPGLEAFPRGFIAPASVNRTAWDSASATGALEAVDLPTLLRLSRVYEQQERYEQQTTHMGELIYAELYRGGLAGILANYRNLASLVQAFAYREGELVALCDQTLAALAAKPDGSGS